MYSDFNENINNNDWELDKKITENSMMIVGESQFRLLERKETLLSGEGILLLFKPSADTIFLTRLVYGESGNSDYLRWGTELRLGEFSPNIYQGNYRFRFSRYSSNGIMGAECKKSR